MQNAQTLRGTELLAFVEEQLEAETDSKERLVRRRVCPQRFDQVEFAEIFHCPSEGAYTRQNESIAPRDGPRIARNGGAAIQQLAGSLHAEEVSKLVVYNDDVGHEVGQLVAARDLVRKEGVANIFKPAPTHFGKGFAVD